MRPHAEPMLFVAFAVIACGERNDRKPPPERIGRFVTSWKNGSKHTRRWDSPRVAGVRGSLPGRSAGGLAAEFAAEVGRGGGEAFDSQA